MPGDTGADLVESERPEMVGDVSGGGNFPIGQFGVRVDVVAPGDDVGFSSRGRRVDPLREGQGMSEEKQIQSWAHSG